MYDLADSLSSDGRFVDFTTARPRTKGRMWAAWSPDIGEDLTTSSMATDDLASTRLAMVSALRTLGNLLSGCSAVAGWHVNWESDGWLVSLFVSEHDEEAYEAAYQVQQSFAGTRLPTPDFRVVALQGRPLSDVAVLLDGHSAE